MADISTLRSYLTFRLGEEIFAASVGKVLEILEIPRITRVPRAPSFMRGVVNLRGNVLPVIDTRNKFGLPETKDTIETCIIVMSLIDQGQELVTGAVVDSVQEVIDIDPKDVQPAPLVSAKWRTEFIQGMVKLNDRFIIILDIDRIFSSNEVALLKDVSEEERNDQADADRTASEAA
jgi:purine-binding chemotaxis protein CheW